MKLINTRTKNYEGDGERNEWASQHFLSESQWSLLNSLPAAFAVSGYATAYYRSHKPFNPLHGETFECVREDKGFRFISEQVYGCTIHAYYEKYIWNEQLTVQFPHYRCPIIHQWVQVRNIYFRRIIKVIISKICHCNFKIGHAEGRGWMFWEEIQPKTKFWGKSMVNY